MCRAITIHSSAD